MVKATYITYVYPILTSCRVSYRVSKGDLYVDVTSLSCSFPEWAVLVQVRISICCIRAYHCKSQSAGHIWMCSCHQHQYIPSVVHMHKVVLLRSTFARMKRTIQLSMAKTNLCIVEDLAVDVYVQTSSFLNPANHHRLPGDEATMQYGAENVATLLLVPNPHHVAQAVCVAQCRRLQTAHIPLFTVSTASTWGRQ